MLYAPLSIYWETNIQNGNLEAWVESLAPFVQDYIKGTKTVSLLRGFLVMSVILKAFS